MVSHCQFLGNARSRIQRGRNAGSSHRLPHKEYAGCSGLNKQIYQTTLTTLTFTGPDGTEYEFRDDLNDGQRMAVTAPCPSYPYTGRFAWHGLDYGGWLGGDFHFGCGNFRSRRRSSDESNHVITFTAICTCVTAPNIASKMGGLCGFVIAMAT